MNTIQKQGSWAVLSDRINQNFESIESDIEYLKRLGFWPSRYFDTLKELEASMPAAEHKEGEQAYVGTYTPYSIYRIKGGKWTDTGGKGGNESGSYDAQLKNVWDSLHTLDRPATPSQNGYMTIEQVNNLAVAHDAALSFAGSTFTGKGTEWSYTLDYFQSTGGSHKVDLPVHGGDDGVTPAFTPALITGETFEYLMGLDGQLQALARPATNKNDGQMTAAQVQSLEDCAGGFDAFSKTTISGSGNLYSYSITLNRNGYGGPSVLKLPVHGGNDGFTPAETAALIDVDTFQTMATFLENVETFESMMKFMPLHIEKVVLVFSFIEGQSTSAEGKMVYDKNSGLFLWEVERKQGFVSVFDYYRNKVGNTYVGSYPQQGRIYICGKRTFIGVANGLSELFKV